MNERCSIGRWQAAFILGGFAIGCAAPAAAAPFDRATSENWGVSVRNTIGSPVAELREGMSSRFTPTGALTKPPFGTGSLGIEVNVISGAGVDP